MIALLVIAAVITVIACIRIGIFVEWSGMLALKLVVGPFRFVISSGKKAPKKVKEEKTAGAKNKPEQKKKKFPINILRSNWKELAELISRVLRMPLLDPLVLKITVGGDDPAQNALRYGGAWALIGSVLPFLESRFHIGKRDIDVICDQKASDISVYVKTALTARLGQCIALAISAVVLFFKIYQKMKETEKAVQVK